MNSIARKSKTLNPIENVQPNAVLNQLDLIEHEVEYRWEQFAQLTLDAQRQLDLYDAAVNQRRELAQMASKALARAEERVTWQ
jgi:hypothetical protein